MQYAYDGAEVHRFACADRLDLLDLYARGDVLASANFAQVLDRVSPDVVHFHAFTSGVSIRLIERSKEFGAKVVFTYHTPTVSCQRGSLIRFGAEVCDGRLEVNRCCQCVLEGHGLPRLAARGVASMPTLLGTALAAVGFSGRVIVALRMRELLMERHAAFRRLVSEVDRIVAVSSWVQRLLVVNGVSPAKVFLSRHGLTGFDVNAHPLEQRISPTPLRLAFLGRLIPDKGLDLIIEALSIDRTLPVSLDVYGVEQESTDLEYSQKLRSSIVDDSRISFRQPVSNSAVLDTLRNYDALVVPSRVLETGPLVVLEAFAAGIPVIGADLGGVAELVTHDVDGLLVRTNSAEVWADTLGLLVRDGQLLSRLRARVVRPRSMRIVAHEMASIYREICAGADS